MVLTILRGLGKAYLKSQAKTIKSVAPFSKTGGKTVEQWKKVITNKKSEAIGKKYRDELKAVGAKLTSKVNQTAKNLEKLNKTLKKQKKILDD